MNVLEKVKSTINYWWIYLLIGVFFILGAMYIFSVPVGSYVTLSIFFAAMILIDGIGSIFMAFSNKGQLEGWGWQLASGILSTLIGFSLFTQPELSMVVLPIFVGFWVLMKGSLIIGSSFDLKSHGVDSWGWILFLGSLNIILGLVMIMNPIFGAKMILLFTAISFLTIGFSMIMLSLKLRSIKVKVANIKDSSKEKLQDLKRSVEGYLNNNETDLQSALKQIKEKVDKAIQEN